MIEKSAKKRGGKWELEKFHTGGGQYESFSEAMDVVKGLRKMSSGFDYKVVKED